MTARRLAPGRRCRVWIGGPELPEPLMILETDRTLFEAPNWTLDAEHLVLNGDGALWLLPVPDPARPATSQASEGPGRPESPTPRRIEFGPLPELNNDHVLSPDGSSVYMSAADTHIYRGLLSGGAVQRVTPDDGNWHFLHGVSPDGRRLAYVEISGPGRPGRLVIMELSGALVRPEAGPGHLDGPEWSPDGSWIYLNTEAFTDAPGHAQLARLPDGGGPLERLRTSDTVDWFPHLSPDGTRASYISFPTGTLGHPADLPVQVTVVSTSDWSTALQSYSLFGGQGTLNVNSWAPDSTRFAFVSYD